jgi:hypothetical protein
MSWYFGQAEPVHWAPSWQVVAASSKNIAISALAIQMATPRDRFAVQENRQLEWLPI